MKRTMFWSLALLVFAPSVFAQDNLGKGKVALSTRDTATAIQAFKDAVKAGQKPAEANYYLGAIANARHNLQEAQTYLEASIGANEETADALALLADVYVARKNIPAALGTYRRAAKAAPKSAGVATGYGLALLLVDSVDVAIIQLTKAKDLEPNNPAVFAGLGDAYFKQNVAPLAVTNYQKAIELAPRHFAYRYKLARIYEKSRQYTEAVAQYDSVATLDPSNPEPLLQMGQILVRATGHQQKLAIAPLRKFVASNPKSVEGWTLLAKALYLTEDYDEAAKAAKSALDLDKKNPELWRQYGSSLVETKGRDAENLKQNYQTAIASFEELRRMNAFKPEDQARYGLALAGVGRDDDAMKFLLAAIQLDSTNCDPYFPLGSLYMKKLDWASATHMFEKKILCDPRSLSAYLNAAASYMQLKNWDRSRQLLDTALALKPDFLQARLWLARYFLQVDSLERAKEQYDRVLQETAENPDRYKKEIGEAHSMTASYFFTRQRYDRAIDEFRKALATGTDNSPMQLSWGQAILQTLDPKDPQEESLKKKDEAMKHLRRSIELDQNNAPAHLWLAQSLVLSRVEGDNARNKQLQEEACGEYKKALRLQPSNADAKKGMERIGCK